MGRVDGWVTNEKIMPIPVFQLKVCQLDRVWQKDSESGKFKLTRIIPNIVKNPTEKVRHYKAYVSVVS